jgi:hypothetical protein
MTRSPVLALPEAIIALLPESPGGAPLRRFSVKAGLACSAILALLSFTPLSYLYFRLLIAVPADLAALSVVGGQAAVLLPLVIAWGSWLRGKLTAQRATAPMTVATVVNLVTMAGVLAVGVAVQAPGVALAAVAMTLATAAETTSLWLSARRLPARAEAPAPAAAR